MKHWFVSLSVLGTVAACGCSSTGSSPAAPALTSAQADCERTGHVWRASLNKCESLVAHKRHERLQLPDLNARSSRVTVVVPGIVVG